jgi:hypothetical protein
MSLLNFLPTHSREPLPEFGLRYLQHILAEYVTLPPDLAAKVPAGVQAILNSATASPPAALTWGDLFVLEKNMLAMQPELTVRRRAWGMRDAYRELFGQRQYEVYMASKPPNENESGIADVRADLDRLLDNLHWRYALTPIRERMRNGLIKFIGNWVFWSAIVLLILAYWSACYDQTLVATLLILMLAGSLGGFMSLLQRIQNTPALGDPLISIFEIQNGAFSLYLAPVTGAVFALLLYLIFLGGLVSGVIFPEHLSHFHLWWGQVHWEGANPTAPDFAKLVVWSFIAGFAERFVPDTLDRLVSRAREAEGPSKVPAAPQPPFSIVAPGQALQAASPSAGHDQATLATDATSASAPAS